MNKPDIPPMLSGSPSPSSSPTPAPKALVNQPIPVGAALKGTPIPPTPLTQHAGSSTYVDPYLFAAGYYASPSEYQELSRTAATRIQLRADVENARPKPRTRPKN
jgi:hypothetical protein